jgi:uncharacterized membrane protein SpoIIM required for sporulation
MAATPASDRGLRSVQFRKEREATWRELEALVTLVGQRGIRSLQAEQLARLPHLYRATLSSLSVARSISLDRALTDYLESLCGRAYVCVYGTRESARSKIAEFFAWRWPDAVRRSAGPLLVSALFFLLGAVTAFVLVTGDLERYYAFMPDGMAQGRDPSSSIQDLRDGLYDRGHDSDELGAFAAMLFSHNAGLGILAFALGFVLVPTVALLLFNGLALGAFTALYHARGLSLDVWGWLLPHGVTELLAIVLCGAAGLTIGQAWVFPGNQPRLDRLRERGRVAALVVVGAVLMLFLAGLIEGIFRQTVTDREVRWAVAGGTALWWTWYFALCGRRRARRAAGDEEAAS